MKTKEQNWKRHLEEISSILKKNKVDFFLDTGTLLGAIREQRFIPWDNDIDLGILYNDGINIEKILEDCYTKGYNVNYFHNAIYIFKGKDIHIGITLYKKEGFYFKSELIKAVCFNKIQYFLLQVKRKKIIKCLGYGINYFIKNKILKNQFLLQLIPFNLLNIKVTEIIKEVSIPQELFSSFIDIEFYGEKYNVPKKNILYLKHRYGENWKTPVENYNYIEDDKSLL